MSVYTGFCEAFHDLRNREHQEEYQKVLLETYWELARSLGHDCTLGIPLERLIHKSSKDGSRSSSSSSNGLIMERKQEAIVEAALNRTYSDGPFRIRLPTELVQLIVLAQQNKSVFAKISLENGTPSMRIIFKLSTRTKTYSADLEAGVPLFRDARWIENDEQFSKTVICEAVRCQFKTSFRHIYNTWSPTTTEYLVDPQYLQSTINTCRDVLQRSLSNDSGETIEDCHRQTIHGIPPRKTTYIKLGRTALSDNLFTSLPIPIVSYYMNLWSELEGNAVLLSERFLTENLSAVTIEEHINSIRFIVRNFERLNRFYNERLRTKHSILYQASSSAAKKQSDGKLAGICSLVSLLDTFRVSMLLFVPTPMQLKMIFTTAKEILNLPDSDVLNMDELYLAFSEQPYKILGSNTLSSSDRISTFDDYSSIFPARATSPFLLRERGFAEHKRVTRALSTTKSTTKSSISNAGEAEKANSRGKRSVFIPLYNDMSICHLPNRSADVQQQREHDMYSGKFHYTGNSYSDVISTLKSRKMTLETLIHESGGSLSKNCDEEMDVTEVLRSSSSVIVQDQSICESGDATVHSAREDTSISHAKENAPRSETIYFRKHNRAGLSSNSIFSSIFVSTASDAAGATSPWKGSVQSTNDSQPRFNDTVQGNNRAANSHTYSEPERKRTCLSSSSSVEPSSFSSKAFNIVRSDLLQERAKQINDQRKREQEQKEELARKHEKELLENALAEQRKQFMAEQKRLQELEETLRMQKEVLMQRQEVEVQVQAQTVSTPMPTDRSEANADGYSSGDNTALIHHHDSNAQYVSATDGISQEKLQDSQYYKYIKESETTRIKQLSQLTNLKAHAKFTEFHQEAFDAARLCVVSATVYRELEAFPFAGTMKDILFTMWMGYDISEIIMALFSSVRACALATPAMFEGVERNTMKNVIKAPNMNVISERNERSKQLWYDRNQEILETVLGLLRPETKNSVLELINFCSAMTKLLSLVKQTANS